MCQYVSRFRIHTSCKPQLKSTTAEALIPWNNARWVRVQSKYQTCETQQLANVHPTQCWTTHTNIHSLCVDCSPWSPFTSWPPEAPVKRKPLGYEWPLKIRLHHTMGRVHKLGLLTNWSDHKQTAWWLLGTHQSLYPFGKRLGLGLFMTDTLLKANSINWDTSTESLHTCTTNQPCTMVKQAQQDSFKG